MGQLYGKGIESKQSKHGTKGFNMSGPISPSKPPLHPGKPVNPHEKPIHFPTTSPTDKIRIIAKEIVKSNVGTKK